MIFIDEGRFAAAADDLDRDACFIFDPIDDLPGIDGIPLAEVAAALI